MQKQVFLWLVFSVAFLLVFGCKNDKPVVLPSQTEMTEQLLQANISAVDLEDKQIDELILHNKLQLNKSGTGLRYTITGTGEGEQAKIGQIAVINYTVKLLSGELLYSSASLGAKEFKIGSGNVEAGLEEGILLMKKNQKAIFIIPSYLAHGLVGDDNKIPAKSTIIYEIELVNLK